MGGFLDSRLPERWKARLHSAWKVLAALAAVAFVAALWPRWSSTPPPQKIQCFTLGVGEPWVIYARYETEQKKDTATAGGAAGHTRGYSYGSSFSMNLRTVSGSVLLLGVLFLSLAQRGRRFRARPQRAPPDPAPPDASSPRQH